MLQAFAFSVNMLSRAPSCAGHAQVSVRADKAEEGDAAAARVAGGASARAGGRAIRRSLTLQKDYLNENFNEGREECAFGDKFVQVP